MSTVTPPTEQHPAATTQSTTTTAAPTDPSFPPSLAPFLTTLAHQTHSSLSAPLLSRCTNYARDFLRDYAKYGDLTTTGLDVAGMTWTDSILSLPSILDPRGCTPGKAGGRTPWSLESQVGLVVQPESFEDELPDGAQDTEADAGDAERISEAGTIPAETESLLSDHRRLSDSAALPDIPHVTTDGGKQYLVGFWGDSLMRHSGERNQGTLKFIRKEFPSWKAVNNGTGSWSLGMVLSALRGVDWPDYDAFWIQIGAHDAAGNPGKWRDIETLDDIPGYRSLLQVLIDEIRSHRPGVPIVLLTPMPAWVIWTTVLGMYINKIRCYCQAMKEVAAEKDVFFVDCFEPVWEAVVKEGSWVKQRSRLKGLYKHELLVDVARVHPVREAYEIIWSAPGGVRDVAYQVDRAMKARKAGGKKGV